MEVEPSNSFVSPIVASGFSRSVMYDASASHTNAAAAASANSTATATLPPLKGNSTKNKKVTTGSKAGLSYHHCNCYGHEDKLPNYKLLAIPRTNNYYAATGGCPCIPRAAAHPGSWRLKESQMRSATYRHGTGCLKKSQHPGPAPQHCCCRHTGYQYGWKPGPHTVYAKNTAATGKCDTFGNLAFKSKSNAYHSIDDDVSDVSSATPQKLADLEALILEEHDQRMLVEMDVEELDEVQKSGTQEAFKKNFEKEALRRRLATISEQELQDLLREIKDIVERPLNQTNMDLLRRILVRQDHLQKQREYYAAKKVP